MMLLKEPRGNLIFHFELGNYLGNSQLHRGSSKTLTSVSVPVFPLHVLMLLNMVMPTPVVLQSVCFDMLHVFQCAGKVSTLKKELKKFPVRAFW